MGFGGAEDLGNFRQGCGVNFQKPMCVFVVFGRGFVHIDHARSEPKRTLIHERLDFIGQFKPPSQSLDWQGAVRPTGGAFVASALLTAHGPVPNRWYSKNRNNYSITRKLLFVAQIYKFSAS
jgi:hypothetical protein